MKKLIMCMGLPGSGKTTWAVDQIRAGMRNNLLVMRVNKDEIRSELETTGWSWSPENEREVERIRDERISEAFAVGANIVISDDTNFARQHKMRLAELAGLYGATFEVKRFHTPVAECIDRDALRVGKAHVGEAVIRRMADRYRVGEEIDYSGMVRYVPNEAVMPAIICDLDGTLALHNGRSPYDGAKCGTDLLNKPIAKIVRWAHNAFYQVIYLSGRDDTYREETKAWLTRHDCPPGPLYMRKAGDRRKDWIVKSELFDAHVRSQYDVKFVLDDRNQVVNMWRVMGLTCLQVAPGDF